MRGDTHRLRCAVIGTGDFAAVCHVPGLLSHPGAEVVAVCGEKSRARALADRFGIATATDDVESLCSRADIDAVTIVSRNSLHAQHALTALRHRKHVFCEKPLGTNLRACREMLDAAHTAGRVHQVAFVFRYNYGVRELRRRVLRGDIGQPFYCRIQYDNWDRLKPGWQPNWRDAEGGPLADLGSHLFDLARHVVGPIDRIIGFTQSIAAPGEPDLGGHDVFNAWTQHANGARGQFFVSRVTPSLTRNGWLEVIGPDGALKAALSRGAADALEISTPTAPEWRAVPLPPEAGDRTPHCLPLMMRAFVDACLRGRSDPEVDATFVDGFEAQRAIEAVRAAAGCWTDLSPRAD